MSSSEGLPYVQHNTKNDLEASGSNSNVDSNEDENESSSDSGTKIENASILDTLPLKLDFQIKIEQAQPARALASKLSGEVPDCLFDDGASTLAALAASIGL
nr:hypothetical protein CFP56_61088 [Quercus suber]